MINYNIALYILYYRYCIVLKKSCSMIKYDMLQHIMISNDNIIKFMIILNTIVWYHTISDITISYNTILYDTILFHTLLYNIIQYYIYNIIQYNIMVQTHTGIISDDSIQKNDKILYDILQWYIIW